MKMKHDFVYVPKDSPNCKTAYDNLMSLLQDVRLELESREKFTFQHEMVGSYVRDMITYDKKSKIGFDFDVNLYFKDSNERYSAKKLKSILKNALEKFGTKYGFDKVEDSTRVLTIKMIDHQKSSIKHSVDFAIVNDYLDDEGSSCQEYIHFNKKQNSYYWAQQSKGYAQILEKVVWIKEKELWENLRDHYIDKKNRNENPDVHSRTIFAISVHEICQKNGFYDEIESENRMNNFQSNAKKLFMNQSLKPCIQLTVPPSDLKNLGFFIGK